MPNKEPSIEQKQWKDVAPLVEKVNPTLAAIISKINPDKNYPVYLARYTYGSRIVDKGILQLPISEGSAVPISSPQVPNTFKDNLQRRSVPLSLLLSKASEVFFEMPDRIVTLNLGVVQTRVTIYIS